MKNEDDSNEQQQEQKTPHKRASRKSWPPIYKRTHRSGQVGYLVDLGHVTGQRIRKTFSTKADAETFAEQARVAHKNEGVAAFSLPQEARVSAAKCLGKLAPYNATLEEAVDYYVKHVLRYRNAPTVAEIGVQMLNDAKSAGRRERTIRDLQTRMRQFSAAFGNRRLGTITLPELQAWLNNPVWSPRTRINYAVKVSQLYNFAIKHNWADANLAEKVSRPTPEDKEPGILTVKQVSAMLEHAPEFHLLPYVALGLFAGLRSAEIQRLDWSAVKLSERSIIIGAEVAKKHSRRVVEINNTLAAWLAPYVKERGPVVSLDHLRERFEALRKKASITEWPDNALRHSFGSYHLAAHGDAVKTAAQMGHRDTGVLHNHYKALVTKTDAERFWALRPAEGAENVIPMRQTA
jgi:integrase